MRFSVAVSPGGDAPDAGRLRARVSVSGRDSSGPRSPRRKNTTVEAVSPPGGGGRKTATELTRFMYLNV